MFKLQIFRSFRLNSGRLFILSLLLAVCYLINAGGATAQTIDGCADKTTGQLRRIIPPAECKTNEIAVNWSVAGPQGIQGPTGPQGIQGEPGPAGTVSRLITVGTGFLDYFSTFPCSTSEPFRSLVFIKQTDASRLRITYYDTARVAFPLGASGGFYVEVKIDGAAVSPTPLRSSYPFITTSATFEFSTFGYANGIPAGTHTLTSIYKFYGIPAQDCYRNGYPYTVEVEEIP